MPNKNSLRKASFSPHTLYPKGRDFFFLSEELFVWLRDVTATRLSNVEWKDNELIRRGLYLDS